MKKNIEQLREQRRKENWRDTLVRDLTPDACIRLLVHAHVISPERRRALIFKGGPAFTYFSKREREEIKRWIEQEDFVGLEVRHIEHPKLPTHWCDRHGEVVTCDCLGSKKVHPDFSKKLKSKHWLLQQSSSSICPGCRKHVSIICSGTKPSPWFFICFRCERAWEVGKGEVEKDEDQANVVSSSLES